MHDAPSLHPHRPPPLPRAPHESAHAAPTLARHVPNVSKWAPSRHERSRARSLYRPARALVLFFTTTLSYLHKATVFRRLPCLTLPRGVCCPSLCSQLRIARDRHLSRSPKISHATTHIRHWFATHQYDLRLIGQSPPHTQQLMPQGTLISLQCSNSLICTLFLPPSISLPLR